MKREATTTPAAAAAEEVGKKKKPKLCDAVDELPNMPRDRSAGLGKRGLTHLCATKLGDAALLAMDRDGWPRLADTLELLPADLQITLARQVLRRVWRLATCHFVGGSDEGTPMKNDFPEGVNLQDEETWACVYSNAQAFHSTRTHVQVRFTSSTFAPPSPLSSIALYPINGLIIWDAKVPKDKTTPSKVYRFDYPPLYRRSLQWANEFLKGLGFSPTPALLDELSEEDAAARLVTLTMERQRRRRWEPSKIGPA